MKPTQPKKTPPKYISRFSPGEWGLAFSYLTIGSLILYVSTQNSLWNPIIEKTVKGITLGKITRQQGIVQIERSSSDIQMDVLENEDILSGTRISTKNKSIGNIKLQTSEQIRLLENTDLQLSISLDPEKRLLTGFYQGVIQFTFPRAKMKVQVQVVAQTLEIQSTESNSQIQLEYYPKHSTSEVILTSANPILLGSKKIPARTSWTFHIKDSSLTPLTAMRPIPTGGYQPSVVTVEPQLSSPLQGSRFECDQKASKEVLLSWNPLPDFLKVELEMTRAGKPYAPERSKILSQSAKVSLPCGKYTWKVRSFDSKGNHSQWAGPFTFALQQSLEDEIPVTLIEHHELLKAEEHQKILEARAEAESEAHHQELLALAAKKRARTIQGRKLASVLNQKRNEEKRQKAKHAQELELYQKQRYSPIAEAAKKRKAELLE